MADDLYEGFADRYDLFSLGVIAGDEIVAQFYHQLFAGHNVGRVLDCACGTGQDLLFFQSLGCQVVGSDTSDSMLAQAQKNIAARGLIIPLHRIDYRKLPQHFPEAEFDAVACLSSSILHMPDDTAAVRAFESMRAVLRDGGILILTQGTTDRQWDEKPRFILALNTRDLSRLFVIDYIGQGARYNIVDIFHGEQANEMKVWSVDYPRIHLRDDQERLLQAAGFQGIQFYGTYQFDPYDKAISRRLITVART